MDTPPHPFDPWDPPPPPPPPHFDPWDPPPPPPPPFDGPWLGPPFHHPHMHRNNHRRRKFNHHHNHNDDHDPPGFSPPQFPRPTFSPPPPPLDSLSSKPPFPPPPKLRKFDHQGAPQGDGTGTYAKLYVSGITRTTPQQEIRDLFQEFGDVLEVVLPFDKWSGLHQEYCFVKYSSVEEAESAIEALNNQFTFAGATIPIRVRYADKEKERLGLLHRKPTIPGPGLLHRQPTIPGPGLIPKVYVHGLNREASQEEIVDIFSSYGVITDVYIMREQGSHRNRGCGFIAFAQRFMALAAINGLNGTYVMRGCNNPLLVRFADPKKPKNGEMRSAPNFSGVPWIKLPNDSHARPSCVSTQQTTSHMQADMTPDDNHYPTSCQGHQQSHQKPFSSPKYFHVPCDQTQSMPRDTCSTRQMHSQPKAPLLVNHSSNGDIEVKHDDQAMQLRSDCTKSNSTILASDSSPCALSGAESKLPEAPTACEWSEHVCPEGDMYYFNCVTFESRWEKPQEFLVYEKRLRKQQLQNCSTEPPHLVPDLAAPSPDEDCQIRAAEPQEQPHDSERSSLSVSCAAELSQVQAEMSSLDGAAVVQ